MLKPLKELFAYRHLVANLVSTEIKVRYRRSFLGVLWTLLNPVLLMLVMWVVFSRFGKAVERNYAMFLLSGLMTWIFFQQSVAQSLNSITKNSTLMQKIYVPKLVFPVSTVLSNLVNFFFFLVAYHLIVGVGRLFGAFESVHIEPTAPVVFGALLMVFILATGVGLLMGTLNVFFRDFQHLTQVMLRVLFYLTPVLYRPNLMGEKVAFVLRFNPVYYPVVIGRATIYDGTLGEPIDWLLGFGAALLVLLAGIMMFAATDKKLIYYA